MIDKIRSKELLVVANNNLFNIPAITGFDLTEIEGWTQSYRAILVIDIDKILNTERDRIMGDLVRTLAVAEQYPFNGFQRRLERVYNQALGIQQEWLIDMESPLLELDPRSQDFETLTKKLIGDKRYYSDVGFEDWQKAIESYRKQVKTPKELRMLNQLKGATVHFMTVRQRFLVTNFDTALSTIGSDYINKWDKERRAEAAAYNLLGISLYTRR